MDRPSVRWLRGCVNVTWVSGILVAGCGSAHHRTPARRGEPAAVAMALLPGTWLRSQAPARPGALTRSQAPARPGAPTSPKAPARPTWLINPDQPLPANTPWRPVLAVARRFAVADMSYEVDEVGPGVRAAIADTCTEALAAELLSHRATLPPGTPASQVRQRLVAVAPLDRLPNEAVVLATVRSAHRRGPSGALELRLVPRAGGWRVAGITVV